MRMGIGSKGMGIGSIKKSDGMGYEKDKFA